MPDNQSHAATLVRVFAGGRILKCDCGKQFPTHPHPEPGHYEAPEWEAHVKEARRNGEAHYDTSLDPISPNFDLSKWSEE